jgi:tetratricopeptide (TPR) repeat protein
MEQFVNTAVNAMQSPNENESNIAAAEKFKTEGNEFFSKGDMTNAILSYHKSLLYLRAVTSNSSNEHKSKVKQLRIACYLNLAAAQLREGRNLEKVVKYCNEVLQAEPGNVKALFRRGKARNLLNDLEAAKEDLMAAAKLDPGNKDVRNELESVKQKLKAYREKEKEIYARVVEKTFGSDSGQGAVTDEKGIK